MKIAVAGKGGSGKTSTSTLLTKELSRSRRVLAFDADSNENLAYALGFPSRALEGGVKLRQRREEIFSRTKTHPDWQKRRVTPSPDAEYLTWSPGVRDALVEELVVEQGHISLCRLGTVESESKGVKSMCDAFSLSRIFLNHLQEERRDVVLVDLPAGVDPITRSIVVSVDAVVLVTEPTRKNLDVAVDIAECLRAIGIDEIFVVANKSFEATDKERVATAIGVRPDRVYRMEFSRELVIADEGQCLEISQLPSTSQQEIQRLVTDLTALEASENGFVRRAKALDARLFPEPTSVMTEEQHV